MTLDIEGLYRTYGPMVLRRCRAMLSSESEALDAMQETFVGLIRFQGRLSGDYPSTLLYRMATNVCLNALRSRKRSPTGLPGEFEIVDERINTEEKAVAKDELDWVFSEESESTRLMAWLHYVDGMTLEETAATVGLSVSGVRKRLRTLKARTLARMEEHDGR